jgi:hypothetical protein
MSENPIFKSDTDKQWYFWDETWSEPIGPYRTEKIAKKKLEEYCENLLAEAYDEVSDAGCHLREVKDFAKKAKK